MATDQSMNCKHNNFKSADLGIPNKQNNMIVKYVNVVHK